MTDDVRLGGSTDVVGALESQLDLEGHRRLAAERTAKSRANAQHQHKRAWLLRRMLLAADVLGLLLAFFIAQYLFEPRSGASDIVPPVLEFLFFLCAIPVWILAALLWGLYDRDGDRTDHSTADDLFGIFSVVTIGSWIVSMTAWLTHVYSPNPPRMVSFWALAIVFIMSGRAIVRSAAQHNQRFRQNTLIFGAGDVGQLIARKLLNHPEYGINLLGFVDDSPKERRGDLGELTVLGTPAQIEQLVWGNDVDRVIIAFSNVSHAASLELVRQLKAMNVQVDIVPRLFEILGPRIDHHTVEGLPLIGLPPAKLVPSSRLLKRGFDIVGATLGLILLAPLLLFIAVRIKLDSPGPVFFRQTRLGQDMLGFMALKFRTMRIDTDDEEHRAFIKSMMTPDTPLGASGLYKLDRADAVTPFGRWLRKTSLDELPQLINVLRGDMSLVGPRPCIPYETENFAPHHFERFLVPAGMTGLWQVTARAKSTFGEALEMDVAYARGWSFGLDVRLVLRTPAAVFRQRRATV